MGNLSEFTNLFQLSKTLRFELKPVGKTSELLKEGNLFTEKSPLKNDKQRADKVKEVKKMMDEKHKDFINKTLSAFTFPREVLENYYSSYLQVNAEEKKRKNNTTDSGTTDSNGAKDVVQDLKSVQDAMRKSISVAFKKSKDDNKKDNPEYTRLKPKNLIEKDLSNEDAAKLFNQFTTFFENYRTNRENIYSDDAKATAIAYRVVHVNLPLFIGNMKVYEQIKDKLGEDLLTKLFDDCKAYATSNEMAVHANSLDEVFTLMYFNNTLTQDQIDFYNTLIGKIVQEDHVEIKGINENINLYNQQQKNKEDRLPFFAPLKKQILSDRKTLSWQQESFKSDREVIDAIDNFYFKEEFDQTVLQATRVLLSSIAEYNLYGIFIKNDNNLSTLSQRIYKGFDITQETIQKGESESIEVDTNSTSEINNHGLIEQALKAKLRVETKRGKKKPEDYENEIEKKAKAIKSLSVQTINDIVNEYVENTGSPVALLRRVEDYFYMLRKGEFDGKDLVEYIQTKLSLYKSAKEKWQAGQNNEKFKDSEVSKAIKELLDATKQLECFLKPLLGTGEETDRDMQFYLKLQPIWETLRTFAALYDKVRNWMTRKPYSLDKIKLCFDIPDLLNGWVDSKTEKSDNGTQYGGYLFRKENEIGEYDYYLGISSQKKLFRRVSGANGEYQRLDYYQPKSTTIYGKAYQGKSYKDDKERLKEAIINYITKVSHPNK